MINTSASLSYSDMQRHDSRFTQGHVGKNLNGEYRDKMVRAWLQLHAEYSLNHLTYLNSSLVHHISSRDKLYTPASRFTQGHVGKNLNGEYRDKMVRAWLQLGPTCRIQFKSSHLSELLASFPGPRAVSVARKTFVLRIPDFLQRGHSNRYA